MAYKPKLDGYDFLKSLGKGAFGEVWLVADKECQRSLAMKVLLPDHRCKTEAVAQLANEARVMASLPKKHPNLVQIHFFKRGVANCFLAMELIEGKSLEKHTSVRKPMPWDRATRYLLGVADGLAGVHAQTRTAPPRHQTAKHPPRRQARHRSGRSGGLRDRGSGQCRVGGHGGL